MDIFGNSLFREWWRHLWLHHRWKAMKYEDLIMVEACFPRVKQTHFTVPKIFDFQFFLLLSFRRWPRWSEPKRPFQGFRSPLQRSVWAHFQQHSCETTGRRKFVARQKLFNMKHKFRDELADLLNDASHEALNDLTAFLKGCRFCFETFSRVFRISKVCREMKSQKCLQPEQINLSANSNCLLLSR